MNAILRSSTARPNTVPRSGRSGCLRMYSAEFARITVACIKGYMIARRAERCKFASQSRAADSDQRVEHGLQVEGRAADDLEHVGGRGLLLKRFAQFVEQPRVLDGDDGLIGEVSDQRDLLSVKGRTSCRYTMSAPISSFSFSMGTATNVRMPPSSTAATIAGSRLSM